MTEKKKWNAFKRLFTSSKTDEPPAPAKTAEPEEPGQPEWKQKALADFSAWIEALPDTPPPGETATADSCDLYTLLSEFSALRQEIKMQNREQHRSIQTLTEMADAYQKSMTLFEKSVAGIDQLSENIRTQTEKKAVLPFLDVRDALVRGHRASQAAIEKKRWYRPGLRGIEAVAEGYEMAIRRFDRALSYAGITPVQALDQPFDPKTMKAIGKRSNPEKTANVVLEEQTGGFVKDSEVIRTAEVIVNDDQSH
ncbi:MAG TPA: nucleotide exchange factor GrpE [Desulfosalsimonadaceae bacterium]|nr:nucleotide exchange factor GrpE [Desulfosalsimonadaceae bacterium]